MSAPEASGCVGDWLDRLTAENLADAKSFAARYKNNFLVAVDNDPGSSAEGAKGGGSGDAMATEMLDAAKVQSGVLASRDAKVYAILPAPGSKSPEIVVGRSRECDVWIDDTRVSKKHAGFTIKAGVHTLRDLGSTNGTFVNDRRIDKGESVAVQPHDHIRFGRARKMHFMDATGFYEYLALLRRFGI